MVNCDKTHMPKSTWTVPKCIGNFKFFLLVGMIVKSILLIPRADFRNRLPR